MIRRALVLALVLTVLLVEVAWGQQPATGFPPHGSFQDGRFDAVNVENLNVFFAIPIAGTPGRGLSWNVALTYNSLLWEKYPYNGGTWGPVIDATYAFNWGWKITKFGTRIMYDDELHICESSQEATLRIFNFRYVEPDGTVHHFDIDYYQQPTQCNFVSSSTNGHALDGSGYYSDGTHVYSPSGTKIDAGGNIIDSNGNFLSVSAPDSSTLVYKDTLGRDVLKIITSSNYTDYLVLDKTGGYQTYRLNLGSFSIKTNFGCSGVIEYTSSGQIKLPVSLDLPNGQSYSFEYEPTPSYTATHITARIKKVTLPTGGTYQYEYPGSNNGIECSDGTTKSLTRIINDGSSSATWQYARSSSTQSGQTVWKTTVTAPVFAGDSVANQSTYEFKPFWTTQLERDRTEKVYQGSESTGTLLRTVVTNSLDQCPPRRITTTVPGGKQSKVETDFNCTTGLLTETREYDWHATTPPLVRKTTLSYLGGSSYTALNIIDRVSQIVVRDGSGNIKSKTVLSYDGTTLTNVTGVSQHDDTNYGSGFSTRGNPTSITSYADAASDGGGVTRTLFYDTLGNLREEKVANVTQRQWAYSSTTQFAYPDSVTLGPSGGDQLETSATYNFHTGLIATATDANDKTTEFTYDSLGRLTKITRPDDAEITYSYNDSNREITVESPIQSTDRLREKTFFDELGRAFKVNVSDGSGGNCSSAETRYDSVGRAFKQSNPSSCGSTPSFWTETQVDALGRPRVVVPPDGTASANRTVYAYSDNSATVTDPTGKQRRSYTDALGRLIQVDEPSSSAATPASAGTGNSSVSGTLQTADGTPATPGTGTVTIGETQHYWEEQVQVGEECILWFEETCLQWEPVYEWQIAGWDSGSVSITVNGFTKSVNYSQSSTTSGLATSLASAFNGDSNSPVNASASSNVVTLTSKTNGASTNYSLTASSTSNDTQHFNPPSYTATPSGSTLTGGADATSITYDAGQAWVAVNGFEAEVNYGQGSTAASVASAIADIFNTDPYSPVVAYISSSTTINVVAKQTGTASNYSLTKGSSTNLPGTFSQPSFSLSVSGSTLTGGTNPSDSLGSAHVTQYTYNVLDLLTQVSQGDQTRSYTYDDLGRVTGVATPETKHSGTQKWVTNEYNAFGLVIERTDPRGVVTTYDYDTLNRLEEVSYDVSCCTSTVPATSTVSYTYGTSATSNNNGRLITVTDGVGSESYTYDQLGQITQVQKVISSTTYTTGYEYNLAGAIKKITYPSGREVQQTFDAKGRLASVAAGSTTYVNSFSYTVAGQVSAFSYGNGVSASFGFNAARLQLESLSYANGSTTLLSLAYGYTQNGGNNGQITSITDNTGTQEGGRSVTYAYDALHRLKEAETSGSTSYPKWGLEWSYDRYGNRLSQSISDGCQSPMTCPTNSVSVDTTTNRLTGSPYTYDENGNMLNDGLNTLAYDAESRVVRVNSSNPMYVYDGAGLRVKKCDPHCTSPTTTTVYVFSGSKVIAEYVNGAAVNSPTREYVYSGNVLAATHEGSTLKYVMADHMSPRLVTSDNGSVLESKGHFPFGEVWYEGSGALKWKFTSYERDPESVNDYAIARSYVSRIARFCSPDPIAGSISNPQSLNRYAYVRSDPVNFTDPLGLCAFTETRRIPAGTDGYDEDVGYFCGGIGDLQLAPKEPEPEPFHCRREVIKAFKDLWAKARSHGKQNYEAGRAIDKENGSLTFGPISEATSKDGEKVKLDIDTTEKTVAIAHTHPGPPYWQTPQGTDINPLERKIDRYLLTRDVLWLISPDGTFTAVRNSFKGEGHYWEPCKEKKKENPKVKTGA